MILVVIVPEKAAAGYIFLTKALIRLFEAMMHIGTLNVNLSKKALVYGKELTLIH